MILSIRHAASVFRPAKPTGSVRHVLTLPALLLALMLAALACASAAPGEPADSDQPAGAETGKLTVVTTLNIVADWVAAVGGDGVVVTSLLPADTDPHNYKPGAQDVARVAEADLVVTIGQGLEDQWVNDLVSRVAKDTDAIVSLNQYIDLLEYEEGEQNDHGHGGADHGHGDGDGDADHDHGDADADQDHDHGPLDPHFWFDPLRVKDAVGGIAERLAAADPNRRSEYEANAAAYAAELDTLHHWIEEQITTVPEERRLLVSSHDSLRYFAHRYGFKVVGAVKPPSGQEEPTAQEMTELVEHIKEERVPAIFTEDIFAPRLSQRIAEETGVQIVSALRTSSLDEPGSPAGTYLGFMRYNVGVMVEALK
ncbi:MAG: metal ABC transporter substrate-binding protein [Chloroflexi bacterium]|nr:metal ABC transporter substrate-binding protein [Chloroflexota bacterium]